MAKLHTKGRGRSKSRKPEVEMGKMPEGVTLSREELESLIEKYARQGMHQARIGQVLKREHNIPYIKQALGKRLGKVLEEKGVQSPLPRDMLDLIRRAVNIRDHLSANHGDVHNAVRLKRVESKIWRLTKYYKKSGVLPEGWRYEPEKAALLIKGE